MTPPPECLQTTENSEPYVILCLFCIYMPMILFDILIRYMKK